MNPLYKLYYMMRGLIPRPVQLALRRELARTQRRRAGATWPINPAASDRRPPWNTWPEGKQFAVVLTHDVETSVGVGKCDQLMQLERRAGFRSAFNFVPERYFNPPEVHARLRAEGFEIGVHGLLHDGKLYQSEAVFNERAVRINHYIRQWNATGFRSPAMHHNLEWLHRLDIRYDESTFDTDPFEPDPRGAGTIFPFPVRSADGHQYTELPYTLPQDSTLFLILGETDIRIWKEKLDWLAEHGGMALINTHPDYMRFSEKDPQYARTYPADFYKEWLDYIRTRYKGQYWQALPREMAAFASQYFVPKEQLKTVNERL